MNSWRTIAWGIPILAIAMAVAILASSSRAEAPHPKGEQANTPASDDKLAKATFAGGCFWCMEPPFEKLPGVVRVTSGYTGGSEKAPSYSEVSSGRTGHVEAVQVEYDPSAISYEYLLKVYLDSDLETIHANARDVHPDLTIFDVSCRSGDGLGAFYGWLKEKVAAKKAV